jgi:putative acetyltransferase
MVKIREIEVGDNEKLALIIRNALTEFGANQPGTVYYDPTTDHLFELFQTANSKYFVAEENAEVLGGAGIFPTQGLPEGTCELVKMYLRPTSRGRGLGKELIRRCISVAEDMGYKRIYLETMPELKMALTTYEKFGFNYLERPMGESGHFGCGLWMLKEV